MKKVILNRKIISFILIFVMLIITNTITVLATTTISTDWSNWNMTSPASNSSSLKITTNTAWVANSSVSWITLNTYSGSSSTSIMMYIAANTGAARTGYITIYAGNTSKTITINQPVGTVAASISTDWSNWNMTSPTTNSSALKITTNTSWAANPSVSWITLNTYSGAGTANIMMYIAANTGAARTGYITIYAGNISKTITINQPAGTVAATISTDWSNWNMTSPAANSSALKITTNTEWSASSNVSWITLNTYSGASTTNIMIYITANTDVARTGCIIIRAGNATKTITINQPAGVIINTSSNSYSLNVPRYAQSDSRWGNTTMTSSTSNTISNRGCAVCSVAMLEAYKKNSSITPLEIRNRSGQLTSSGDMVWSVAGIQTPSVKYSTENQYAKAIYDQINNNNPVIVQYNTQWHYVIAYGYQNVSKDANGNPVVYYSNILIRDPASDNLQTLDKFVAKYGISGLLYYR